MRRPPHSSAADVERQALSQGHVQLSHARAGQSGPGSCVQDDHGMEYLDLTLCRRFAPR